MAASRGNTEQPATETGPAPTYDPAGEVVELCRDLIRIDTSNYGDESGPGERKAAEHVAGLLDEVGIESELFELDSGRTSLVAHVLRLGPRHRELPPTGELLTICAGNFPRGSSRGK